MFYGMACNLLLVINAQIFQMGIPSSFWQVTTYDRLQKQQTFFIFISSFDIKKTMFLDQPYRNIYVCPIASFQQHN